MLATIPLFFSLALALMAASANCAETFQQGRITWKRSSTNQTYPPAWLTAPASSNKPEWLKALNAALKDGRIPNIPPSALLNGRPTYPAGIPDPCNWSLTNCQGKHDIYTAPDGYMGIQFDDGPTPATPQLNDFLHKNHIGATHFMIGSNILLHPAEFEATFQMANQHIAVHTWSHNLSTTLTNEEMLAELGWTMQIIFDKSGKIPSWWRAPMGDLDDRIRAIASEVFGLTAVNWNYDAKDWCMEAGGATDCPGANPGNDSASILSYIDKTVALAPKSPGMIMLEHEVTNFSVNAFIHHTWPGVAKYGWKTDHIAGLFGLPWYANSLNNTSPNSDKTSLVAQSSGAQSSLGTAKGSAGQIGGPPPSCFLVFVILLALLNIM
ncbi:hypothetical protein OC845_006759 [Tilletia horrida]|nr:hypothetical protein OC845_006759 [Tilletia horrida]